MQILENQNLKPFCTFQIGGAIRYLINWQNTAELPEIINKISEFDLPFLVIGGGSNLLFPDKDLNAVIIRCNTKEITHTENELVVDAGVRWAILASYMKNHGLYGIEALLSIPGTVGGAVWGNAGCHKQEVKDTLIKLEYFDTKTNTFTIKTIEELTFEYRHSEFSDNRALILTRAWFLVNQDESKAHGSLKEYQQFRLDKQPQGLTTGSFFKNPPGNAAGALIEDVGLKGYRLGNVGISDKHANFVINHGGGTAQEVVELTKLTQDKVLKEKGIELIPEVKVLTENDFTKLSKSN